MITIGKHALLLTILGLLTLTLPACGGGDDDDDLTGPGDGGDDGGGEIVDTEAPQVVWMYPGNNEFEVDPSEPIEIYFNEPMDQNTSPGQVTMSHGSVSELTWFDEQSLSISHTAWPAGTAVTVTVNSGLADIAGNFLAAPQTSTFYTYSPDAVLMAHTPADGAANFNRAGIITLQFSRTMRNSSLESGITIKDDDDNEIPFTVTYDPAEPYLYRLIPSEDLPASSDMTVSVTSAVLDINGNPLATPVTFVFTTGLVADVAPPVIASIDPPSGSTIPRDQGVITVTFDEPVVGDSIDIVRMNGQMAWVTTRSADVPYLNGDRTVLTLPLGSLPAGIPLSSTIANITDDWGNTQTAGVDWSVTVAGTADHYPIVDGQRYIMAGERSEGALGNIFPDNTYYEEAYYETAARETAGEWEAREYEWNYSELDYYEILSVSASQLTLLGFGENLDNSAALEEVFTSTPITLAELPYTVGDSWSTTATFTVPDGTLSATVSGSVVGQTDLPITEPPTGQLEGVEITWTDVWQVTRFVDLNSGSTLIATEAITFWIAPGIGVVRQQGREDELAASDEPGWVEYDRWLLLEAR